MKSARNRNPAMSCGVVKVVTQLDNHQQVRTSVVLSFQQGEWPPGAPNTFLSDITVDYDGHPQHVVGQKVEGAYDGILDLLKL
jgi:hypothetical protein